MRNFITEESVFILGVILLALLIAGNLYAEQKAGTNQIPTSPSTTAENISSVQTATSTPSSVTGQTNSTIKAAPSVQSPLPRSRREQEYDDD